MKTPSTFGERVSAVVRYTFVSLIIVGPILGLFLVPFVAEPVPRHLVPLFVALFVVRYYLKMLSISFVHRGTVHNGFKAHPLVTIAYLFVFSTNMQGPVINWAQTHRVHHAHADKPGDPHSPTEGFWHAHFGWLYMFPFVRSIKAPFNKPEHTITRFFHYTYVFWLLLDGAIMYTLFGFTGLVWLWLVCNGFVNQVTYCVNSVCHIWGERPCNTDDLSRNNAFLMWFTPEAGHNFHHDDPRNPDHGRNWRFDISFWLICQLEKLKLVSDVHKGKSSTT